VESGTRLPYRSKVSRGEVGDACSSSNVEEALDHEVPRLNKLTGELVADDRQPSEEGREPELEARPGEKRAVERYCGDRGSTLIPFVKPVMLVIGDGKGEWGVVGSVMPEAIGTDEANGE
jgi:hypothetical protein